MTELFTSDDDEGQESDPYILSLMTQKPSPVKAPVTSTTAGRTGRKVTAEDFNADMKDQNLGQDSNNFIDLTFDTEVSSQDSVAAEVSTEESRESRYVTRS